MRHRYEVKRNQVFTFQGRQIIVSFFIHSGLIPTAQDFDPSQPDLSLTSVISQSWNSRAINLVRTLLEASSAVAIQPQELKNAPSPPPQSHLYGKLFIQSPSKSAKLNLVKIYPSLENQMRQVWIDVGQALIEEGFCIYLAEDAHDHIRVKT